MRRSLAPQIRRVVQSMDPTLPIVRLRTMDDVFGASVSRPRLLAQLLGTFAGLALLLAAVGTYGILAFTVTERRKEIGILKSLGASKSFIIRVIEGEAFMIGVLGVVYALVVVKAYGLPSTPAMLSMAVFLFLSTLVEPLFLNS